MTFKPLLTALLLGSPLLTILLLGCTTDNAPGNPPPHTIEAASSRPLVGHASFSDGRLAVKITVMANDFCEPPKPSSKGGGYWYWGPKLTDIPAGLQSSLPGPALPIFQPGVMIHLQFANQSSKRIVFTIDDFYSTFGNFVIQPNQLTLDPEQAVEVEPLNSRLTVSGGESVVTLTLRLAGIKERNLITLRTLATPAGF